MKKIDKNQIFTVILGFVMLILSLESIALVCKGFSNLIAGIKGTGVALSIITGFLLLAPLTFFAFKLLDKGCDKLRFIAACTNLVIILTVFIFAIVLAATKRYVNYAPELMIVEALLAIAWFLLDFATFKANISSFKIVKVETKTNETKEETIEEAEVKEESVEEEITEEK